METTPHTRTATPTAFFLADAAHPSNCVALHATYACRTTPSSCDACMGFFSGLNSDPSRRRQLNSCRNKLGQWACRDGHAHAHTALLPPALGPLSCLPPPPHTYIFCHYTPHTRGTFLCCTPAHVHASPASSDNLEEDMPTHGPHQPGWEVTASCTPSQSLLSWA